MGWGKYLILVMKIKNATQITHMNPMKVHIILYDTNLAVSTITIDHMHLQFYLVCDEKYSYR